MSTKQTKKEIRNILALKLYSKTPAQLCVIDIHLNFLHLVQMSHGSDILCVDISPFDRNFENLLALKETGKSFVSPLNFI